MKVKNVVILKRIDELLKTANECTEVIRRTSKNIIHMRTGVLGGTLVDTEEVNADLEKLLDHAMRPVEDKLGGLRKHSTSMRTMATFMLEEAIKKREQALSTKKLRIPKSKSQITSLASFKNLGGVENQVKPLPLDENSKNFPKSLMRSTKNLIVDVGNKFEKKMINIGSIHTITSQKNLTDPESTLSQKALAFDVTRKFCDWCGGQLKPDQYVMTKPETIVEIEPPVKNEAEATDCAPNFGLPTKILKKKDPTSAGGLDQATSTQTIVSQQSKKQFKMALKNIVQSNFHNNMSNLYHKTYGKKGTNSNLTLVMPSGNNLSFHKPSQGQDHPPTHGISPQKICMDRENCSIALSNELDHNYLDKNVIKKTPYNLTKKLISKAGDSSSSPQKIYKADGSQHTGPSPSRYSSITQSKQKPKFQKIDNNLILCRGDVANISKEPFRSTVKYNPVSISLKTLNKLNGINSPNLHRRNQTDTNF